MPTPPPTPSLLLVESPRRVHSSLASWAAETFPDCTLRVASSPQQGVRALLEHRPYVTIVDADPAGGDGFAALRLLREVDPQALLVAVSDVMDPTREVECRAAGADAVAALAAGRPLLADLVGAFLAIRRRFPVS